MDSIYPKIKINLLLLTDDQWSGAGPGNFFNEAVILLVSDMLKVQGVVKALVHSSRSYGCGEAALVTTSSSSSAADSCAVALRARRRRST